MRFCFRKERCLRSFDFADFLWCAGRRTIHLWILDVGQLGSKRRADSSITTYKIKEQIRLHGQTFFALVIIDDAFDDWQKEQALALAFFLEIVR